MSISPDPSIAENENSGESVPAPVPTPVGFADLPSLPTPEEFLDTVRRHARYSIGKEWNALSGQNLLLAISLAVRDIAIDRMIDTEKRYQQADAKRLYYLSMEFLVGRSLGNNLANLGILDICRRALASVRANFDEVRDEEHDAALGNGGLGRLAACFLDSMATLGMPGFGYGINYEYGLFRQEIENGWQKERPDHWLSHNSPWLIERPDEQVVVQLYGRLEQGYDRHGNAKPMWMECKHLIGLPSDMPIIGYGGVTVNYLRLYSARASDEFDIQKFNEGQYVKAVEDKIASENISKVLYPSDAADAGRELRLIQEYFFVACAIRDILRSFIRRRASFHEFPNRVAIQLNDTHPALAVAELMRVLMDENLLSWDQAWEITVATIGFTNHTLLPEALEKWPEPLLQRVLPRHLSIIQGIDAQLRTEVAARWPNDHARIGRMAIIEDHGGHKQVRMAMLAITGSHAINGVAKLHSELIKSSLVPDYYEMWPERFSNKTNGVTQRRWLLKSNEDLAKLLTDTVGDSWITDLDKLRSLEGYAHDQVFQRKFLDVKRANKERLSQVIKQSTGVTVDPSSLFDVIAKRIHEYKRQLLMVLRIIHEYLTIIEDRKDLPVARTYIFAGKAAPGYWAAKQIVKLINELARVINNDARVRERIKVVFIPDYRVSLAEKIIPGADMSEHISTAGKEASGTSNMKFSMNGALNMCTYDGANIEISEAVGEDNVYIFGLKAAAIQQLRETNSYSPWDYYRGNPHITRVMDCFNSDRLFGREWTIFQWIYTSIVTHGDPYFHLADFESYIETHQRAAADYRKPAVWAQKAILNVARMGRFSSDRTIREYADEIWKIDSIV